MIAEKEIPCAKNDCRFLHTVFFSAKMTKKCTQIVGTMEGENLLRRIELSQKLIHGAVRIQQNSALSYYFKAPYRFNVYSL